jgi:hypothetical protein
MSQGRKISGRAMLVAHSARGSSRIGQTARLLYRKYTIKVVIRSSAATKNGLPSVDNQETGTMLPKDQLASWAQFYDSARHNEILDEKTTVLIHLAVAMSVGCYP